MSADKYGSFAKLKAWTNVRRALAQPKAVLKRSWLQEVLLGTQG
jgi:hypothetical protein